MTTEWDADAYRRRSGLQQAMAAEALAGLSLRGSERVLDVGCGDGRITAEIAERLPTGSIVGVDPSHAMVALASRSFPPSTHPNLRFLAADARHLPFSDEFDLVLSFNALHWVPEGEEALASIAGALKLGGEAALRLVPASDRTSLEEIIEAVRQSPRWTGAFAGFRTPFVHPQPEIYAEVAARVGLKVLGVYVQEKAWDFRRREDFLAFARATFAAWTNRLPPDDRDAFIVDVLDRYRPVARDDPGEENVFKFSQMDLRARKISGPLPSRAGEGAGGRG